MRSAGSVRSTYSNDRTGWNGRTAQTCGHAHGLWWLHWHVERPSYSIGRS